MSYPSGWDLVNITGTYIARDGTPCTGSVTLSSPQLVLRSGTIVTAADIVFDLVNGTFSGQIPATDDPNANPSGWTYTVTENVPGGRQGYQIVAPHTSPGIDLSTVVPVTMPQPPTYGFPYVTLAQLAGTAVGDGAYLIGYQNTGAGSASRTVQSKLSDIVSTTDFSTLAQAWAAAIYNPLINPTTGKTYFNTDPSKLDYSTSRAGFVWQHRDTASGANNEEIPGSVFQFNSTGNGVVNASIEKSYTIWEGVYGYHYKSGDGSGQVFTATGELGAYGSGGYNELGGFQAQLTNVGSALGTISGVEMLLEDSPDGGTTTYSTKMQAVVGRIAKYNPTIRPSYHFYASSEGTQNTNGIVGVNPSANKFERGLDFTGAAFSTGQATLFPNNTAMAWLDTTGTAQPVLGVDGSNNSYVKAATTSSNLNLQDGSGLTRLQITSTGLVAFQNATLTTSATAGTNGAVPSQVGGYLEVVINGSTVKIPYFNV